MTEELYSKTFGGRLKELRENRGWTQEEVCRKVGMSQQNYCKYEKDIIRHPTQTSLQKFSDLYGIPIDILVRKGGSLDHIPAQILNMIQKPDSLPFLVEANKKYQQYLEEKRSYDNE